MRKKVDSRIRTLIENGVKVRHRSLFVIVGDRGREQVVNLHYILSKIVTKKPSILWCYKQDLGFSSHRKKRMKQMKKKTQRGQFDPNIDDPFELFVTTTNIRYCYYKESQNILGQTYGMCVLQDFEAVTPNILCHTMETVEGGGFICILLNTMSSLRQLYSITMDLHVKLRTENFLTVEPRFNERLILSLVSCGNCLIVDDELNILPLCEQAQNIVPIDDSTATTPEALADAKIKVGSGLSIFVSANQRELNELKDTMKGTDIIGHLVNCTVTCDQARCIMTFLDSISEKVPSQTVAITAARGRGKSAALGLGIAGALAYSYSNIIVTAPLPDMIKTIFKFIQIGLEAMGMKEHADFETLSEGSTATAGNTASESLVTQLNVFRNHRQTVRYIPPQNHSAATQAELLVIDEAAAIPLPFIRKLLGTGLVFLSSTVNGYEGTGRALSLKLIQELKYGVRDTKVSSSTDVHKEKGAHRRSLKEVVLKEPIRYAPEDPVENWLDGLLCLNATAAAPLSSTTGLVPARKCKLYMVNRDALFSYHKSSEEFLRNLMSLFVSSHYKNSPNDLVLLSDAPAHQIFALLPPVDETSNTLPDIYCAVQVCIEGNLSKDTIRGALGRGLKPSGDMVAWTLAQYFSDEDFGALTGLRIVRIACHPNLQRMGYGTESVKQLLEFYDGYHVPISEPSPTVLNGTSMSESNSKHKDETNAVNHHSENADLTKNSLHTEMLKAKDSPPLLHSCAENSPSIALDYFATSFGLTSDLYKFWSKLGFKPAYIRQTKSETTGENSAILMRLRKNDELKVCEDGPLPWLSQYVADFRIRLIQLLSSAFSHFDLTLALSILEPPVTNSKPVETRKQLAADGTTVYVTPSGLPVVTAETISQFLTGHDLQRLKKYSKQLAEHHFILDLIPVVSWLLFSHRLSGLTLSYLQCAILLGMGCQMHSADVVSAELGIPHNQTMALFNKAICKISNYFQNLLEKHAEDELVHSGEISANINGVQDNYGTLGNGEDLPVKPFEAELDEGAAEINKRMSEQRKELLESLKSDAFKKYSLEDVSVADFEKEAKGNPIKGSISIKRKNFAKDKARDQIAAFKGDGRKKEKRSAHGKRSKTA